MDLETSKNINTRYLYMLLYLRATNVEYCLDNLSDFVTILGNLKFFSDTWVTVLFNYLLNSSITFKQDYLQEFCGDERKYLTISLNIFIKHVKLLFREYLYKIRIRYHIFEIIRNLRQ